MATLLKPVPNRIDVTPQPMPALSDRPIEGSRYWSREFMDREWDGIWTKSWLIGGLAAQVAKPGDFFTYDIGRESILVTRGEDGVVRAFYNVCPHRGKRLVMEEEGHSKRIACSYHGWRFTPEGDLNFVPCPEDFPQGTPCGKVRLEEVRCEFFASFVWVNLDPQATSLADHLGPVADQIAGYRMEQMHRTHWVTLEGDWNWKCVQDNFNESYHLPFVHPQTRFVMEQSYKDCQFDLYAPQGHARMFMPGSRPARSLRGHTDTVLEMMAKELTYWGLDPEDFRDDPLRTREALQQAKRALGAEKGYDFSHFHDAQLTDHFHYTIFPNISFSLKPDGCIWLRADPHPTDPERCYFDMWYFTWFPEGVDRYYAYSMGQEVDRTVPVPHQRGVVGELSCGPGIDQDVSIWSEQQKGLRSRGYKGGHLAGQEARVRFFHDTIDRWVGD
ncbi:aromatic ring-hydroxylating oxygenase subunit alpha [Porphyrobacter sp. ULC335]|uniref:aromatic ring-hydroxylating oxygenase subunit alpha n=1 Tax=Porphyrobacter sp. ULC335 TaxID=2854260 RepID=UPI00221E46F3|nr:aromatic ring-hydroxylating dioxygenase subunit alpha [Porphyrobacter sp. ULC335]UYV16069.1 aromatic ring-hydroxylating dioxygenase subunit alpha [Porphyrobacter sp. ULC335]